MQSAAVLILLASVSGESQTAPAGQPAQAADAQKAQAAEAVKLANEEVVRWQFYLGQDRKTKLTLQPGPILRWSNPVAGTVFGDIFVWTNQGRPEVVVSIHNFFDPDMS